ncbi:hypothetical protein CUZ56_02371 [Saezia sanguinis]|uniref:Zinc-ribbon 15 domain-containing protein n=1 Tax=Saezia sanguinis TaxID=1965230 RepID=A0A433SBA3_9BURK|nr:zinc-ribbon domain-containing protein [Saezia sanguinis]RUS66013.1 hypothetical protein CUZ56_02371 [Saezia sanguinis]
MIFIFGTKGRTKEAGHGRFFCPNCNGERNYRLLKVASYFTLFFIPTFPIRELGRYVQCEQCQCEYQTSVLEESAGQQLLRSVYRDGAAGMPLQMITNKLVNAGMPEPQAKEAVDAVAQQVACKECPGCHLVFLADAKLFTCTACGEHLS